MTKFNVGDLIYEVDSSRGKTDVGYITERYAAYGVIIQWIFSSSPSERKKIHYNTHDMQYLIKEKIWNHYPIHQSK